VQDGGGGILVEAVMGDVVFLEVTASGPYPIEIGWVAHDLGRGRSALVRPADGWTIADGGPFNRVDLMAAGKPAAEVARRLNADLAGAKVLTGDPRAIGPRLRLLYEAAGAKIAFKIVHNDVSDVSSYVNQACNTGDVSFEAHQALVADIIAGAGLAPDRALDIALRHALMLCAVPVRQLAEAGQRPLADRLRASLMERVAALKGAAAG